MRSPTDFRPPVRVPLREFRDSREQDQLRDIRDQRDYPDFSAPHPSFPEDEHRRIMGRDTGLPHVVPTPPPGRYDIHHLSSPPVPGSSRYGLTEQAGNALVGRRGRTVRGRNAERAGRGSSPLHGGNRAVKRRGPSTTSAGPARDLVFFFFQGTCL